MRASKEVAGRFPEPEGITFKHGRPPNFEAIAKVFPAARQLGTIFTYGNVIYVSDGAQLPRSLVAHETVHVAQQEFVGRDEWWDRYLHDRTFRFNQELDAHRVELRIAVQEGGRAHRRMVRSLIAKRLSGPLYGHACTLATARKLLKEASVYE